MNLTEQILCIILPMQMAFVQQRTFNKFISYIFGTLCNGRRNTITSIICFLQRQYKDWSSTYRFFSTAKMDLDLCFDEVFRQSLNKFVTKKTKHIVISIDDFRVEKTGKTIPKTAYQLDPKSPPFHPNLMWGHRYLHCTVVLARKKRGKWQSAKSIPIRLKLAPHIKKPGKRATEIEKEDYEKAKKEINLTHYAVQLIQEIRRLLDEFGYEDKELVILADGSYCNKGIFSNLSDRIQLILRCRKDAKLCNKSKEKGRFYDKDSFTPLEIYKNEEIQTQQAQFFYGRRNCMGKFKEKIGVYWQSGAKRRELRCLVVFGIRYRKNKNKYTNYRDPMHLLTTDLKLKAKTLIQWYFYRWEIEVTHRELKNDLGISQAQVRNETSVERCPKIVALAYSIIHLAAIMLEEEDEKGYLPPPKWYKRRGRISLEYLRRRLRGEIIENQELKDMIQLEVSWKSIFERIAA